MTVFPLGITTIKKDVDDIDKVLWIVNEMHKFGHAVQYTDSSRDGKFLEGMVTHYRTCRACLEMEKENVKKVVQPAVISRVAGLAGADKRSETVDGGTRNSGDSTDVRPTPSREESLGGKDQDSKHAHGSVLTTFGGQPARPGYSEGNIEHGGNGVLAERPIPVSGGQESVTTVGNARGDGGSPVSALPNISRVGENSTKRRRRTTTRSKGISKDKSSSTRKLKKEKQHGNRKNK